jgi:hypothetical protein
VREREEKRDESVWERERARAREREGIQIQEIIECLREIDDQED